jgi:hypothetical protein|tara:strand:- start:5238 stop:5654 length:417 start_codon:yes stop_codon:yes gene_type:complete
MGKFVYAVVAVFFIEMALWLFAGATYANSSLFSLIMNPSNLATTAVYVLIFGTLAVFGASTVIPGNFFQINIYALYAGIATSLITFAISVSHLWSFVYGELTGVMPNDLVMAQVITVIMVSPFLIFYILAIAEWVRSN